MQLIALALHIPTTAAGTDDEWYLTMPCLGTWRLKSLEWAPATAVALDAANIRIWTITKNDGAGGADSSAIAAMTTITVTGVAYVLKTGIRPALTQQSDFTQGHQLKFAATHGGTGAVADGVWTAVFEKIN